MKTCTMPETKNQQGFTLIELSIVLVIIGLIVGGILVGQDMIKAAQLRATITQLERYDAAVNTFRTKYNGLPGDLQNCANFFGVCPPVGGTGNNKIDDAAVTAAGPITISGEVAAFWYDLYQANEIGDPMTGTTNIAAVAGAPVVANTVPSAKMGGGNAILAYTGSTALTETGLAGVNLYRIASVAIAATAVPTFTNAIATLDAFNIDSKKDDGIMNTGTVQGTEFAGGASFNVAADAPVGAWTAATCGASASAYNTAAHPTSNNCQLMIRTSF